MSADFLIERPVIDRRAERLRAAGEAEQSRAAADAVRAQTAHRVWELEARRAEHQAAAAAHERQIRREEKAAAAARRAADLRATIGSAVAGLPEMAGIVACLAPTLIATRGQYEFALSQMQLGAMAVLVPLMLEGAAWLLAWRRHQAVTAGEPSGRLTIGVWTLALTAAGLNLWHGTAQHSLQVGAAYGIASLVGFGLVELLAGHRRATLNDAANGSGQRRRRLTGLVRVLRYPRLSWAAWSRRVELGPGIDPALDDAEAWRQAWLDHYGVVPGADAQSRRRGRRRVRADIRHTDSQLSIGAPSTSVSSVSVAVLPEFRSPVLPEFRSPDLPDLEVAEMDRFMQGRADRAGPDVSDLLMAGREVADELDDAGDRLTRAALVAGLRARGLSFSTDRASALLEILRVERADRSGPLGLIDLSGDAS